MTIIRKYNEFIPFWAAIISGVDLLMFLASVLAPFNSNISTTSTWPEKIIDFILLKLKNLFLKRNSFKRIYFCFGCFSKTYPNINVKLIMEWFFWPFCAAKWSAVLLSRSKASIFFSLLINSWIRFLSPEKIRSNQ